MVEEKQTNKMVMETQVLLHHAHNYERIRVKLNKFAASLSWPRVAGRMRRQISVTSKINQKIRDGRIKTQKKL